MKAKSRTIISLLISRTPRFLAIGTAVGHVVVALTHGGPVAVPDVSAYLSVSQWLYGGVLPDGLAYHPGYGFLLGLFGGLTGSDLHTAALITNGVIAGICVLMVTRLMERHGAPQWAILCAALVAALHPSMSAASRIAWPETALVAVLLALGLLVDQDKWTWAGAAAGVSLVLHPRALVIVGAVVVVAVVERRVRQTLRGGVPALVVAGLLLQVTGSWPSARINAAQTLGDGPDPLTTIAGQWLALGAGTGGLALIGLTVAAVTFLKRSWPPSGALLCVSAVGMLVLGGWVLAGSARMDTILYGRYIGPWAVPLTVVGLAAVCRGAVTRRLVMALSVSTLAAALLTAAISSQVTDPGRRIMTLGLGFFWHVFDGRLTLVILLSLVVVLAGIFGSQRSSLIPLTLFGLLALASTIVNHVHLHEVGRIADGQVSTAQSVPPDVTCLAHDISSKSYAMWLYRLELPDIDHRRVNLSAGEEPCGRYVVAAITALDDCDGAKLVGTEPRANWGLWKYPSQVCN